MKRENKAHPYEDIIQLPHHTSRTRPRMSMPERAAQFSPFAALSGYGGVIQEAGRLTEPKIQLEESRAEELERELNRLARRAGSHPKIKAVCFRPDEKKEGGAYITLTGRLRKIDEIQRLILLTDGTSLPLDDLLHIEELE